MGELDGYGDGNPDDPHECPDNGPDWYVPDDWDRTGNSGSARHEPNMADFKKMYRPFPKDEVDDTDEVKIDPAPLSLDGLTGALVSYPTGSEAENMPAATEVNDERSRAVKWYCEQVESDVSELLQLSGMDAASEYETADVLVALIELRSASIEPVVIPETFDATELSTERNLSPKGGAYEQVSRDIADKVKTVELIRSVADIADADLARAYFVEWAKLGSEEAGAKLESLLDQECQVAETPGEYKCLTTVCRISERMGLSPDDWIMRYADTDSAWELQLTYYERQKERLRQEQRLGVDTERKEEQLKAVDAKIDSLIIQFCLPPEDSCALSEDTVSMYGLEVLGASDTLEAATLITGRYLEVIAEMGVTPDNLRKLIAFGKEALLRVDVNMAGRQTTSLPISGGRKSAIGE